MARQMMVMRNNAERHTYSKTQRDTIDEAEIAERIEAKDRDYQVARLTDRTVWERYGYGDQQWGPWMIHGSGGRHTLNNIALLITRWERDAERGL